MNPYDVAIIVAEGLPFMQAFDFLKWYTQPPSEDCKAFLQSAAFHWWAMRHAGEVCRFADRKYA